MRRIVVAGFALLITTSAFAGSSVRGTFRLGPTGIYCVKAPCPWRGIVKVDKGGRPEGKPLWTGRNLPAIVARADVRSRILSTWKASGCLIVEGELDRDRLSVNRIVGGC